MAHANTFKFTLTHATLGSMVISEPDGWKDAKLKMERHPDYNSLVEYFEGSFVFYGENNTDNGGADFIKQCENLFGADAVIDILIEADIDGDGVYEETIFSGQLDLTGLKEVQDNKIAVPIIRNDLWAKFIARRGTPVNLRSTTDLDGNAVSLTDSVDINLTSQKIKKQFDGYLLDSRNFTEDELTTSDYIQFDVDTYLLDEIKVKYTLPIINNPEIPQSIFDIEEDGEYTFDLRIEASVIYYTVVDCENDETVTTSSSYLDIYIQKNDETAIAFTETSSSLIFENVSTIYTYNGTMSLQKGDQIRIYGDIVGNISDLGDYANLWIHSKNGQGTVTIPNILLIEPSGCLVDETTTGSINGMAAPSQVEIPTYFNVVAYTTYPNTSAQGFLLHDAAYAIIKRILGNSEEFRSDYLGSTVTEGHQYDVNGCAWKNMILQGLQLRGYTLDEKQFSLSFDKWWKCSCPLLFLGLGYETYEGAEVVRVEKLSDFFDPTISVNISNVREIARVYDTALLYNLIEAGFQKWQAEDISGIDDPQTKRSWSIPRKKFDKLLQIISDAITAGITIEATRRKTIEKSEDYKYDNEAFIIAINGTGVSPDRFLPELDENFTTITGLEKSESRYNSIHTPLRMMLRWGQWWNSCLQKYQTDTIKFTSGEGNYDMVSDYDCATGDSCLAVLCGSVSEKADISLSTHGSTFGYLFLPLLYTIEVINFTWDEYLLIRNNRRKAIGISQTLDNFKRFFIKELTYEVCKGKCKIIAWPYDETPIRIVETVMPDRSEEEPDEECESFYSAQFTSELEGWTSEGGTDIPASVLTGLAGWENAGVNPSNPWALSSTPDNSAGCCGDVTDIILGGIDTVTGLTYQFSWQIETFGASNPTSGTIKFMLLDADNNILDSETFTITSIGTDSDTITLSPVGANGVNIGVQITNTTLVNTRSYEIQSMTLSGGTGASAAALPSWAWSPNYSGSAKAVITHEDYGVKNFVKDSITVPQEPFTVEIGYVVPTNSSNLSLRFRIYDSSNAIIYTNVFASDIADGNEKTATFDITDSAVWTDADKFEISVEDTATPEQFQSGDEVYITKVEINICGEYDVVEYDAGYQAILDHADTIC